MGLFDAIGSVVGQGIQTIANKKAANKQFDREKQLMDKQAEQNKAMALFNNDLQMQMWKATGPVGQMQQYTEAGLNPGLMYGIGGGGGQTAAAAQAAPVSKGSVQQAQTADWGMALQNAAQLGVLTATKKKLDAEAKGQEIDNINKSEGGIGYKNIEAQTRSLDQGVQNQIAQKEYTESQTALNEIQKQIQAGSAESQIAKINLEMQNLAQTNRMLVRNNFIDQATAETKIKQAKAQLASTLASTALTQAQTALPATQIKDIESQIYNRLMQQELGKQGIEMNWSKINQDIKESANRIKNADVTDQQKITTQILENILRAF